MLRWHVRCGYGHSRLKRRRVDVDVLTTGQLHQLVHDLVGDRPLDEPVTGPSGVPIERQRLADPDAYPLDLRDDLAGRLDLIRVEHRDGDDRGTAFQREPGDTGLAAVEPAVR